MIDDGEDDEDAVSEEKDIQIPDLEADEVWDFAYLQSKMEKREEFGQRIEEDIVKMYIERCATFNKDENQVNMRE